MQGRRHRNGRSHFKEEDAEDGARPAVRAIEVTRLKD